MSHLPAISLDDAVAALHHPPPSPKTLTTEQDVVATGAWGQLGALVLLLREDDGALVDETHLPARHETGHWAGPNSSAGSGVPDGSWRARTASSTPWHGQHLRVLTGQLAVVPGHGWCGDVTVMVSRAVTAVRFVHVDGIHLVSAPDSGLVTAARPVRSWRHEVRVQALDERAVVLGEQVYPFLTDSDRHGQTLRCGQATGHRREHHATHRAPPRGPSGLRLPWRSATGCPVIGPAAARSRQGVQQRMLRPTCAGERLRGAGTAYRNGV